MKVIEWIKEHKTEILIATGTIVLGGLCVYGISKKTPKVDRGVLNNNHVKCEELKIEGFDVGVCDEVHKYNDGSIALLVDRIKLEQMGDLGGEITKHFPNLPENPNVLALLCVGGKRV